MNKELRILLIVWLALILVVVPISFLLLGQNAFAPEPEIKVVGTVVALERVGYALVLRRIVLDDGELLVPQRDFEKFDIVVGKAYEFTIIKHEAAYPTLVDAVEVK